MPVIKRILAVILACVIWVALIATFLQPAKGVISSCTVTATPTSVTRSTTTNLTFSIQNGGSSAIVWVKMTSPSSDFTINSGSTEASGWSASSSTSVVTFTGGSLSAGSSTDFRVNMTTGGSDAGAAAWSVQVSDDAGGDSPTTCGGNSSVAISGAYVDTNPPAISNLSVYDVSNNSAKVTWTTDEASTSVVDYGTNDSYGTTASDASYVTSHSLTLTGLSANTTYHYNVKSTDTAGNTGETGDNTFVTARSSTTVTTTVTTTTTVTQTVTDTTVPGVVLTTNLKKVYSEAPSIAGTASDNSGVGRVEYSIDDGKNWLPADTLGAIGAKSLGFSFTPSIIDDGNYKLRVRVTDSSGNQTVSKLYILIIDRLPPLMGGTLISFGPQILKPTKEGYIFTLEKLDSRIILSSIGGPISIDLISKKENQMDSEQVFSMTKNPDNGLWFGTLSFKEEGTHHLITKAVDGASNKTERRLNTVIVLPAGKITNGGNPVKDVVVSLYYFEATRGRFVLWNGKPFGQKNPQKVNEEGQYFLLIPPGRYFLAVSAPNYQKLKSKIFSFSESSVVNTDFVLKESKSLKIGPLSLRLPRFDQEPAEVKINYPALPKMEEEANLIGKEFPFFSLPTEGKVVSSNDLRGKPTVLTFMTTWFPQTAEQMVYLADLASPKEINVAVVMGQESASKVDIFKWKGGYQLPILADKDGELLKELQILNLPTHIFLDRKGIIKKVVTGVLGHDELINNLLN